MKRTFKHLNQNDRDRLEALFDAGESQTENAATAEDMLKNRLLKRAFYILSENAEARKRRIRLDTVLSDERFVAKI